MIQNFLWMNTEFQGSVAKEDGTECRDSVSECGGPPPLCRGAHSKSAGGPAHSETLSRRSVGLELRGSIVECAGPPAFSEGPMK